jgi:hypothetical protein
LIRVSQGANAEPSSNGLSIARKTMLIEFGLE